jgi:Two component regulator propeller
MREKLRCCARELRDGVFEAMAPKSRGGFYIPSIECRNLRAWSCLFAAAVCCVLYSRPAFSERVPVWAVFTHENSDLPSDKVLALASGADGALWVGTFGLVGGLARLDKDGRWQTYSKASTRGGLPEDYVRALAGGADGALWVGTFGGGLARLDKDGRWQTYSKASTQGGLPDDHVSALAGGVDGALWVGTVGGLARLDKDGRWQTYSKASTQGGLPDDNVRALAGGVDGALWVGTNGGLGNFRRPLGQTLRIVEVSGGKVDELNKITEPEQTIAATAFDDSYLTQPGMFHYIWRLNEINLFGNTPGLETKTRSSVYRAVFPHDGAYQLRVVAVDRYGNRSEPKDINFKVTLPKPKALWEILVSAWPILVATVTSLLALGFITLLLLARRSARAFRILSDAAWAKWLTWPFFFLRHVPAVQRSVLEPWFQAIRRGTMTYIPFLDPPVSMAAGSPSEGAALLQRLRHSSRIWLHGRCAQPERRRTPVRFYSDSDTIA